MGKPKLYIHNLTHYHPSGILGNDRFENNLDTSSEWIIERTGILERRFMDDYQGELPVTEISQRAVATMVLKNKESLSDVDLILSCSTHDDLHYPNPGNLIAEQYGLRVPVMQLKAACASVVYGIETARAFIQSEISKKILIVNGEPFTRFLDYGDRSSSILFGDAATCFTISSETSDLEVLGVRIGGQGFRIVDSSRTSDTSHLTPNEFTTGRLTPGKPFLNRRRSSEKKFQQDGRAVVNFVLDNIPGEVNRFLEEVPCSKEKVQYFICHQSNLRMMEQLFQTLGLPKAIHLNNIEYFGNVSSAGWISVLSQNRKSIPTGSRILATVFGAGMTWGNLLLLKR